MVVHLDGGEVAAKAQPELRHCEVKERMMNPSILNLLAPSLWVSEAYEGGDNELGRIRSWQGATALLPLLLSNAHVERFTTPTVHFGGI